MSMPSDYIQKIASDITLVYAPGRFPQRQYIIYATVRGVSYDGAACKPKWAWRNLCVEIEHALAIELYLNVRYKLSNFPDDPRYSFVD